MAKALLLDRDGVINVEKGYVFKIEDFEFISGIFKLLTCSKRLGFLNIVLTNQSGIARGYYSEADFLSLNRWMLNEIEKSGAKIDKVYYCPHHPDVKCNCRKPSTGMFDMASSDFDVNMNNSIMVGDRLTDMQAAKFSGVKRRVLIKKYDNDNLSTDRVESLREVIKIIKEM